jgi:hypothetical protein
MVAEYLVAYLPDKEHQWKFLCIRKDGDKYPIIISDLNRNERSYFEGKRVSNVGYHFREPTDYEMKLALARRI